MPVRANKFREVEGGGTTWYASRTEAVGLGRVVPSSSTDFFSNRLSLFFPQFTPTTFFKGNKMSLRSAE
jgi:hypothetical protein